MYVNYQSTVTFLVYQNHCQTLKVEDSEGLKLEEEGQGQK